MTVSSKPSTPSTSGRPSMSRARTLRRISSRTGTGCQPEARRSPRVVGCREGGIGGQPTVGPPRFRPAAGCGARMDPARPGAGGADPAATSQRNGGSEVAVVERSPSTRPVAVHIVGRRSGPPLSTVLRRDGWRVQPDLVAFGLLAFVVYSTWAAFRDTSFYTGAYGRDYLSPFYSPCLTMHCTTAGYVWGGWSWWRISPALLILIFPLAFRTTCYYYRKSYYRAFWLSPPACAVADAGSTRPGGARSGYTGETRFPLILQNVHRYTWYVAVIFAGILTWDAIAAFRFPNGIGMGLGTLVFVVNAVLIWAYTL